MKVIAFACLASLFLNNHSKDQQPLENYISTADTPRIQVAILLDVSGSMNGLIEQAKTQLWSMVEILGKANCNGIKPNIEIALYDYGTPENKEGKNFIRQISPFTSDLDSLSASLFSLRTNGGDEYCGAVMVQSLNELQWDNNPNYYKVIFIAGNESFKQGSVPITQACELAKQKNVIINTIYCGNYQAGITEYWNLYGECGNGTYTNIDQNSKSDDIPTPQDSMIYALNNQLNESYIAYNSYGNNRVALQSKMDEANAKMGGKVAVKRAYVKANKATYKNGSWDLVDAFESDSMVIKKLDKKYLPAEYQNKSEAEIKAFVKQKTADRSNTQQQLTKLILEREKFIAAAKAQNANSNKTADLENAIQNTIKTQAVKFNISFDK